MTEVEVTTTRSLVVADIGEAFAFVMAHLDGNPEIKIQPFTSYDVDADEETELISVIVTQGSKEEWRGESPWPSAQADERPLPELEEPPATKPGLPRRHIYQGESDGTNCAYVYDPARHPDIGGRRCGQALVVSDHYGHRRDGEDCAPEECGGTSYDPCTYSVPEIRRFDFGSH